MNWIPRKAEDTASNQVAGETVIAKATTGTVTVLSTLGGEIWEMCDGSTSLDEIISQLGADFDESPGTIRTEVEQFMESMVEKGMITR